MRIHAILAVLLMLPGCERVRLIWSPEAEPLALPAPLPARAAIPVFALLSDDAIEVEMSDGTICRGSSDANPGASGWVGTLSECPYTYAYEVQLAAGSPVSALPLRPVPPSSGVIDDSAPKFSPVAALLISTPDGGRYRFESEAGF